MLNISIKYSDSLCEYKESDKVFILLITIKQLLVPV